MGKLFIAQLIDILNRISMKSNNGNVNLNTKANITKTFKLVYKLGTDVYGYNFAKKLSDYKIFDGNELKELLMSPDFIEILKSDKIGMFLIKKIKLPSKAEIAKEMKEVYNKYKDQMSKDPDDVDDPLHTYAIRTQFGDGPVVFVEGIKSEEGRREVRKWYAWMYKVNYFQVRECSFEHWVKHPETQEATDKYEYQNDDLYKAEDKMAMDEELIESINSVNESFDDDNFRRRGGKRRMMDNMVSKRFNKYRKFDDFEDNFDDLEDDFDDFEDIYNRNNTDDFYGDLDDDKEQDIFESSENVSFAKGDMVEKINGNGQGFIVIDVLESDAEIEAAKRKRRYRTVLPKDFEISSENPALALMSIKGPRGGLNFIYAASDFKHVE